MSFDKTTLKSGDIVFVGEDEKPLLLIDFGGNLVVIGEGQWYPIGSLDNVKYAFRPKSNLSLSKVFSKKIGYFKMNSAAGGLVFDDYTELFNAENEVKELTIQEIADKFNVNVDMVRIKE